MAKTKIEWVKNADGTQGKSWNPIKGTKGYWTCEKVSAGCRNCYAERINYRLSKVPYTPNADTPRLDPKTLEQPAKWKTPRTIFVCSMTDLFWERVDEAWIYAIYDVIKHKANQHKYIILTKRPERMEKFFRNKAPISNLILGVSVENKATAKERIPFLSHISEWYNRMISYEPALEAVNWYEYKGMFDWLVAGGESGQNARPSHPENFIIAQEFCKAENIPFFFKQWGAWGQKFIPAFEDQPKPQNPESFKFKDGTVMYKFGKRNTGNELNGIVYNEMPFATIKENN